MIIHQNAALKRNCYLDSAERTEVKFMNARSSYKFIDSQLFVYTLAEICDQ